MAWTKVMFFFFKLEIKTKTFKSSVIKIEQKVKFWDENSTLTKKKSPIGF